MQRTETKVIERAGIYVRVSTQVQGKDGYGIDVQKDLCTMFAKLHKYTIVEIYEDIAVSGKNKIEERPAFKRLFEDLKSGRIEVLIVPSLDRIARLAELMLKIVRKINDMDRYLISVKENIDTTTAHGKLLLTILSGTSEYEREIITDRMYAGREKRRKEVDGDIGGKLPYGYCRINKVTSLDPKTAPIVNRIYRLYLKDQKTMAEIARMLNAEKIPTPKKNEWGVMFVSMILKEHRDKYMGGYRNKSKCTWPRLLDPDVVKLVKLECRDDLLPSFAPQNLPPPERGFKKYYRKPPSPL